MYRGMVWVSVLLGCESGEGELDSNSDSATVEATPLVRDLVRVHEEVFDQWVLFTLSEGDCEYPFLDGFGPEEIEIRPDAYPFPDIGGVLSMTVEMVEDGGEDLWSLDTHYAAVAAGSGLSEAPRPVWDGSGEWTLRAPGRNHTLRLSLVVDDAPAVDVELDFGIEDYLSSGYRFGVTGTVDGTPVDTTVEANNPCPGDG